MDFGFGCNKILEIKTFDIKNRKIYLLIMIYLRTKK